MQNSIKTKTRLAYIQFIFSTFFSKSEIIDETEHFQNYFYKLSIPSIEKDQETIVAFNKNFFRKLSFSYFEFIKKNNVDELIDSLINFDRKYKNWSFINKSVILEFFQRLKFQKRKK